MCRAHLQGLGSNRGFHSALDVCSAMQVLRTEGLEAALLERGFCFDVMMLAPMGFQKGIIQPGVGWTADVTTRYLPEVNLVVPLVHRQPVSVSTHIWLFFLTGNPVRSTHL